MELQKEIACRIPSLSLVDEDCGQLESGEDTYPVTFPCVLINIQQIRWKTFATGIQQGSVDAVIRLCIDCYHDTHYGSGTEERLRERIAMYKQLHEIVSGIIPGENEEPWERTVTRCYNLQGGLKVYETTYNCLISEGV